MWQKAPTACEISTRFKSARWYTQHLYFCEMEKSFCYLLPAKGKLTQEYLPKVDRVRRRWSDMIWDSPSRSQRISECNRDRGKYQPDDPNGRQRDSSSHRSSSPFGLCRRQRNRICFACNECRDVDSKSHHREYESWTDVHHAVWNWICRQPGIVRELDSWLQIEMKLVLSEREYN